MRTVEVHARTPLARRQAQRPLLGVSMARVPALPRRGNHDNAWALKRCDFALRSHGPTQLQRACQRVSARSGTSYGAARARTTKGA